MAVNIFQILRTSVGKWVPPFDVRSPSFTSGSTLRAESEVEHAVARARACLRATAMDCRAVHFEVGGHLDRKSTRLNSSHVKISYAVFCLKKKRPYSNKLTLHDDKALG